MKAQEYAKRLEESFSKKVEKGKKTYWKIERGIITRIRINDEPINANNVHIVFPCTQCNGDDNSGCHVISYKNLKKERDGNFLPCCPKTGRAEHKNGICADCIPPKLQAMFEVTEFETYEDFDEEEEDSDDNSYDKATD